MFETLMFFLLFVLISLLVSIAIKNIDYYYDTKKEDKDVS